jgi:uncharacterized protein (TIGR02996 family)
MWMGSMTLSQEQAFLADICANPDDDGVRLIYADWLTEREGPGDRERAEFIRVQCQSQHLPPCACSYGRVLTSSSCRRCLAILRELQLRGEMQDRLRDEWISWGECGRLRWWWAWEFRRGFVEHITLAAADWCRYAERLRATQPIREVTLTTSFDIQITPAQSGRVRLHVAGDPEPFRTVTTADWLVPVYHLGLASACCQWVERAHRLWPGIVFHGADFPEGAS